MKYFYYYSMNSSNVEIISDCFIKPKFISEEAKKPIYFSPLDLLLITINYIQKGLLFRLQENQDFLITTFLDNLKDSLSATLTHFHPLAARLSTVKHQNPSSLTVFLNPENSPGARFIHSAVNLTVDDILTPIDVPLIVQTSFFDLHKAINHDGHELPLLSVKVTELVDGIFIGLSINHMLVDGTSFWHFFNSWSEMFKSKMENPNLGPIILDRWIPAGSDPIITLPFTHEDQFIDRSNSPLLRERMFHFSSDSLSKLKAKVNSECSINNTRKISTLQSLCAVLWRCVTRARRIPADQETSFKLAVNNRSRLSPPLPENYFGNMIQTVKATTTVGELLDGSIGWVALQLHEAVASHGDEQIKQFMDLWLKSPFVAKLGVHFDKNSVLGGSSPRFDMYGNEFGLGKALAVLNGYSNSFDGKVTFYAGREGGGSIDLGICLLPDNMTAFESDEEFISLVNQEVQY